MTHRLIETWLPIAALSDEFIQLRVLKFQCTLLLDIGWLQLSETFAPSVNGLLADFMLLGDLRNRTAICFAQDRNHLFLGESAFLHGLPLWLREPFSQLTAGPENLGRSAGITAVPEHSAAPGGRVNMAILVDRLSILARALAGEPEPV
jgi:hypothetical protein